MSTKSRPEWLSDVLRSCIPEGLSLLEYRVGVGENEMHVIDAGGLFVARVRVYGQAADVHERFVDAVNSAQAVWAQSLNPNVPHAAVRVRDAKGNLCFDVSVALKRRQLLGFTKKRAPIKEDA